MIEAEERAAEEYASSCEAQPIVMQPMADWNDVDLPF